MLLYHGENQSRASDTLLNAQPYERPQDRTGYANGFKPKKFKSRLGDLDIKEFQNKK